MRDRLVPLYLGLAALAVLALGTSHQAKATYIATIDQVGLNVVVTGSGSIDFTDLTMLSPAVHSAGGIIQPSIGNIHIGSSAGADYDGYYGISGPTSFGTGLGGDPNSGSPGGFAGIQNTGGPFPSPGVIVPLGYVSGTLLSNTMTFDNQTLASIGLTPGTYVWTWGSGPDADSFTLQIGPTTTTAVPEPGSLALLLSALAGFLGLQGVRRRIVAL